MLYTEAELDLDEYEEMRILYVKNERARKISSLEHEDYY